MARKTLADFNYDYQKYADYLESPECANDLFNLTVSTMDTN